jgi:hypothetical protein
MTASARTVARAGLLGALALVTAAVTATSAGAASEEVDFFCEFGVGEVGGEGTGAASFDTGIPDGLVVDVGTRVSLDPFTGSITFPEEFVTLLREAGLTSVQGGGETILLVDTTDDELFATFEFGPTEVPEEGTLTVEVEGDADRFRPLEAGVHSILGFDFGLFVDTGGEDEPGAGMFCETADGEDVVIDTLEAVAAATVTPTATVTATATTTATAVRPVVVQTDFADEGRPAVPPALAAGALLALAAGAVGAGRRRHASAGRRH